MLQTSKLSSRQIIFTGSSIHLKQAISMEDYFSEMVQQLSWEWDSFYVVSLTQCLMFLHLTLPSEQSHRLSQLLRCQLFPYYTSVRLSLKNWYFIHIVSNCALDLLRAQLLAGTTQLCVEAVCQHTAANRSETSLYILGGEHERLRENLICI